MLMLEAADKYFVRNETANIWNLVHTSMESNNYIQGRNIWFTEWNQNTWNAFSNRRPEFSMRLKYSKHYNNYCEITVIMATNMKQQTNNTS